MSDHTAKSLVLFILKKKNFVFVVHLQKWIVTNYWVF
jgi:hypothetical protein